MRSLQDSPVPTRLKLPALWTATMFCYVYGDYFGLYVPNKLASVAQGTMGPLGAATPGILVAVSLMMALPSLLIASALLVPAAACRWSNIISGALYTAIIAMLLTASVMLVAWTWPVAKGDGM